jgi:hypothetical protein
VSDELARVDPDLATAPFTWKTLVAISRTEFVPKGLRGKPEAVLACVLTGRELGLGPMEALRSIDMIDGKPSPSGEWMLGRIFEAGHVVQTLHQDDQKVVLRGIRIVEPKEYSMDVTYTIEMARRAGLVSKDNWKKYPEAMLFWRALSMLARQFFPDVLHGVKYLAEELGSDLEPEDVPDLEPEPETHFALADGEWVWPVETDGVDAAQVTHYDAGEEADNRLAPDTEEEEPAAPALSDADQDLEGTPKQKAQAYLDLIDDDSVESAVGLLIDEAIGPKIDDGTRDEIEQRVRVLYGLMERLGLWPEDSLHKSLRWYLNVGSPNPVHWSDLRLKDTMQHFARQSANWAEKALAERPF